MVMYLFLPTMSYRIITVAAAAAAVAIDDDGGGDGAEGALASARVLPIHFTYSIDGLLEQ